MCRKHERRCVEALELREAAMQEWTRAETLEDVRRTWARLGGLMTLHRYGREHYARMGKRSGEARRRLLSGTRGVAMRAALVALVASAFLVGSTDDAAAATVTEHQLALYAGVAENVKGGGYGNGDAYTYAVALWAYTDNDAYAALYRATERESVRVMLARVAHDACPGGVHEDLSCKELPLSGGGGGSPVGGGGDGLPEIEALTHPHILPAQGWRLNSPFDW